MKNFVLTTAVLACVASISACETTTPIQSATATTSDFDTAGGDRVTSEQKQGFSAITGLPYPQALDDNLNYCRKNLPDAIVRKTPVTGYADESRRCRANRCIPIRLSEGYEFIEFQHSRIENLDIPRDRYRARLMDDASDKCLIWKNYVASLNQSQQEYFEALIPEQCVVFDEIQEFSARYVVRQIERITMSTDWITYRLFGFEVVEKETEAVVGRDISISATRKDDDLSSYLSCDSDVDLYKEVIPPLKSNPEGQISFSHRLSSR